jgi:hypothetical protein
MGFVFNRHYVVGPPARFAPVLPRSTENGQGRITVLRLSQPPPPVAAPMGVASRSTCGIPASAEMTAWWLPAWGVGARFAPGFLPPARDRDRADALTDETLSRTDLGASREAAARNPSGRCSRRRGLQHAAPGQAPAGDVMVSSMQPEGLAATWPTRRLQPEGAARWLPSTPKLLGSRFGGRPPISEPPRTIDPGAHLDEVQARSVRLSHVRYKNVLFWAVTGHFASRVFARGRHSTGAGAAVIRARATSFAPDDCSATFTDHHFLYLRGMAGRGRQKGSRGRKRLRRDDAADALGRSAVRADVPRRGPPSPPRSTTNFVAEIASTSARARRDPLPRHAVDGEALSASSTGGPQEQCQLAGGYALA